VYKFGTLKRTITNHTPRTESSLEHIQLFVPGDGKYNLWQETLMVRSVLRKPLTEYDTDAF